MPIEFLEGDIDMRRVAGAGEEPAQAAAVEPLRGPLSDLREIAHEEVGGLGGDEDGGLVDEPEAFAAGRHGGRVAERAVELRPGALDPERVDKDLDEGTEPGFAEREGRGSIDDPPDGKLPGLGVLLRSERQRIEPDYF